MEIINRLKFCKQQVIGLLVDNLFPETFLLSGHMLYFVLIFFIQKKIVFESWITPSVILDIKLLEEKGTI